MTNRSKTFFLILLGFVFRAPQVLAQTPGTFTATGNMTTARGWHTSTLLPDGRVLIAGGSNSTGGLASAELYDPSTGVFTATSNMMVARVDHTATLLPNGKVLVAGAGSAELYDPATETFTATGNMVPDSINYLYTTTLLADGRVLFVARNSDKAAAQVYDPATSMFALAATPISASIWNNNVTLLADGRVLIAQADELRGELYDPRTNTFVTTDWPRLPYVQGPAILLLNGKVLLPGGLDDTFDNKSAVASVYDPSARMFGGTGNMTVIRVYHTATLLPDGTVLIAGGDDGPDVNITANSTELYDPTGQTFTGAADMIAARELHTATLLNNGKVLITGGFVAQAYGDVANSSAELYTPATLIPAPVLFSLSGNGQGPGAIWHSTTGAIVSAGNPALAGESLSFYTTNLAKGGVVPPQVIVGGKLAQVLYFGSAPGYPGYYQVNFSVPTGIASGATTPVLLGFLGRYSNQITVAVQ